MARIWIEWAKIGRETRFFFHFLSLVYYFFFNLHTVIAFNNVQHLVEVKPTKRNFGPKQGLKLGFLSFFQV